jgi:hypothetical protein
MKNITLLSSSQGGILPPPRFVDEMGTALTMTPDWTPLTAPYYKRASSIGFQQAIGNCAGFIASK